MKSSAEAPIPPPRTVFRIACAGARGDATMTSAVSTSAGAIFDKIANALRTGSAHAELPHLQLLTGLADGADQSIASVFLDGSYVHATREHIAVLPLDQVTYLDRSPIIDRERYERLIARSSLVIELDGRWVADDDERGASFARNCRRRAYRAQGRLMVRRADLLLAVFDPDAEARPGGTAETVRYALEVEIPVLVLSIGNKQREHSCHLLRSLAELDALSRWREDPASATFEQLWPEFEKLVQLAPVPPTLGPLPAPSWLEKRWSRFERQFAAVPAAVSPVGRMHAAERESPFRVLRDHVRTLNARLVGRYRGGFLSNFRFAAIATTLAAASLGLMAALHERLHDGWMLATLILLAVAKLVLVVAIFLITRRAHHDKWTERAIGARYLAENLRLMYWTPALGPLHAPRRFSPQHVGEKLDRRTADALLTAHVRAVPAATGVYLEGLAPGVQPLRGTIRARHAIEALRDHWIAGQRDYHAGNWQRLTNLCKTLDDRVERMNIAVICCVAVDIAALLAVVAHHGFVGIDAIKVILVVLAAALPAAVSATNGIREQSEARRLAHRSRQLELALKTLHTEADDAIARIDAVTGSPIDYGGWVLDSLALADRCATLVAEDLAEWSLLYGKEMPET